MGWKNILKNDTNEFFKAARDANKITSFLVDGKSFERTLNKTNDKQTINLSEQQVNSPINEDFNNAVDLVWSGKFENMQALKKGLINFQYTLLAISVYSGNNRFIIFIN
jgi:hypothetical protein